MFLAQRGAEPPVAVKVLLDYGLDDPELVGRFEREIKLTRQLDHPGVIRVLDAGRHARGLYYAMEFVAGETLDSYLRRSGPLELRAAAELVRRLAHALHHAHSRGTVHRDVKPSNVILDAKSGLPRLTDFGLARHHWASNLTQSGDVLGTPVYMSPEQFRSARVDARADVYALGVILYEALTGVVPFKAESFVEQEELVLGGQLTAPHLLRPELPPQLEEIVLQALRRDPNDRYRTAAELEADLAAFLVAPQHEPETGSHAPLRRARLPWVLAVSLALLVGLGAALTGWWAGRAEEQRGELSGVPPSPPAPAPPPAPAKPDPQQVLAGVFQSARGGEPYEALSNELDAAGLPAEDLAVARTRLAYRRGRLTEADRCAEPLARSETTGAREARLLAGLALTFRQEFERATAVLAPLSTSGDSAGKTARSFLCLADDWVFMPADYEASVRLLRSVREDDPEFFPALLCLAYFEVAYSSASPGEGARLCELAQRLAPDHWQPLHMRGRAIRSERPREAIRDLEESAELSQRQCAPTLSYLIQSLLLVEETSKARGKLDAAAVEHPRFFSLILLEAIVSEREGRPTQAEQALARLIREAGPLRARSEIAWLPRPLQPTAIAVVRRLPR